MDGWLLVLSPLALLLAVALTRFVGCKFDPSGTGGGGFPGLSDYSITILEETDLVSYWRLRDATCAAGDTASDEKAANPGMFRIVARHGRRQAWLHPLIPPYPSCPTTKS